MDPLDILYEDNHLLVLNKPAGIATMGSPGKPTLHRVACDYLRERYQKPGNVFLGVVHRLDSMASGAIVFARTSKAASRLSEQFRRSDENQANVSPLLKLYLAVVEGRLDEPDGELSDWLRKDESRHRMTTCQASSPGAQIARLQYRVVRHLQRQGRDSTLVIVRLLTGRKHQIRTQFAERGHCILGDVKYGGRPSPRVGIALHAWQLTISHPTKNIAMTFCAQPPADWAAWRLRPDEAESLGLTSLWSQ